MPARRRVRKAMRISMLRIGWLLSLLAALPGLAQTPEWIWRGPTERRIAADEVCYVVKAFNLATQVLKAELTTTADNEVVAYVNGFWVTAGSEWSQPTRVDVAAHLHPGENVLAFRAQNHGGPAAFLARLELKLANGERMVIVSDPTWQVNGVEQPGWDKPGFNPAGWSAAISLGEHGVSPWGDVLTAASGNPADRLTLLPGFKAELVRFARKDEGSWICLAIDPKGRLIISPQGPEPLLRLTLTPEGQVAKIEPLSAPVHSAMGLCCAFDSLYVNGQGPVGQGLYRLRDTTGDEQFDQVKLLTRFHGGGEHGPHGVVAGPDQRLYIVNGNFVKIVEGVSPNSPHRNYADDQVLPRMEDGNGFGAGQKPPGGHILRTDPEGKHWELFAAGQRNDYDIAFNADGELFGFDSDMEWDWGTAWYRPIRINHLVSGGDYGYREGTAKWPNWYPDSLPTTLDIGVGSPTGMKFGTGAKFPAKYQRTLYAMDWAYGRILAVHLTPHGCTYRGQFENFVVGKGNPVTDLEIGQDGAMYFITGGRGLQSSLYRVTYVGDESTAPVDGHDRTGAEARALRQRLETFHGQSDPKAIEFAWPHLNSEDRWLRYAARIAIEHQPVEQWQARALGETRTNAALTALLALARCGGEEMQDDLLLALEKFPLTQLSESQLLAKLRVIEVSFARQGLPSTEIAAMLRDKLETLYPASREPLNRELCQLLVALQSPTVIANSLAVLGAAPTLEDQTAYILHLRHQKTGWTLDERRAYFNWFKRDRRQDHHAEATLKWFTDAGRGYALGASFPKFMRNIRREASAGLPDNERVALAPLLAEPPPPVSSELLARHHFVKEWKLEDLLPDLAKVSHDRNFQRGREAFEVVQCYSCHRFGDEGGSVGPDITGVANRFNRHDLLENMLNPNKVISDQYQNTIIITKDEDDVEGRLLEETDEKVVIQTNPLTSTTVEVAKSDIQSRRISNVSPMPEGLLSVLDREEILDLLAYLESGGNERSLLFSQKR